MKSAFALCVHMHISQKKFPYADAYAFASLFFSICICMWYAYAYGKKIREAYASAYGNFFEEYAYAHTKQMQISYYPITFVFDFCEEYAYAI